jgi:putative molybdopterin biosynthesis protein
LTELSDQYLTTRELAELLHIKERKVYELAASGEVPCSRATGKLLFPRQAVVAWVASKSGGSIGEPLAARPAVFHGSHDPLLEWALRESGSGLAMYWDGSLDGLERFALGEGIGAGLHIYDERVDDWNAPLVASRFANSSVVLVEFAWRDRGLIVDAGEAPRFPSLAALAGHSVVARQPEAGSQRLLEQLLPGSGIDAAQISFAEVARTESDAAIAVAEGRADAAFGLRGPAMQFSLDFVPVVRERFDLLLDRREYFEPSLQRFLAFCRSAKFSARAEQMSGYDIRGLGTVHFNG